MLLEILISFLLIGISAYGGGLVTIPLIIHEIVEIKEWISIEDITSLIAIAQMTPGPIAVNAATFVGFKVGGWKGSLLATAGVILPAIIILSIISPFVEKISSNKRVKKVRRGLQVGVVSLIFYATWTFGNGAISGVIDLTIAIVSFLILLLSKGKFHPIFVIILGGVLGVLIQ